MTLSPAFMVVFLFREFFQAVISSQSIRSFVRGNRFPRARDWFFVVGGDHFPRSFQVQGRVCNHSILVHVTNRYRFKDSIPTLGYLHVGFIIFVCASKRLKKGNICSKDSGAIRTTKCFVTSTTRFATYIGGDRSYFRDKAANVNLSVSEGTTSIVNCDSTIILFSYSFSFYHGADRHFVSKVVRSFPSWVVRAYTANKAGMRPKAFASYFRSFRGLSLANVVFLDSFDFILFIFCRSIARLPFLLRHFLCNE